MVDGCIRSRAHQHSLEVKDERCGWFGWCLSPGWLAENASDGFSGRDGKFFEILKSH